MTIRIDAFDRQTGLELLEHFARHDFVALGEMGSGPHIAEMRT